MRALDDVPGPIGVAWLRVTGELAGFRKAPRWTGFCVAVVASDADCAAPAD